MQALAFRNTEFEIIDRNNQPWLRATQIGLALDYADGKAIQRIYSRNKDEFTDAMTGVVKLTTPTGEQESRIFSLRGAHLLAMLSRTAVAKEFRRWVLDILEGIAEVPATASRGQAKALPNGLTPAQQRHIQNRVAELARSPGNSFANVYRSIKDQFQVGSYKDVPAERYPALCHYLMTAPLEGELVEGQQQAVTQGQHTLTDSQMYEVYVTAFHFAQLHRIFRESRLYDHLTGLGSRIGIDMVDHFTDGGAMAAGLLRQHAAEFEGVQRRLRVNAYR